MLSGACANSIIPSPKTSLQRSKETLVCRVSFPSHTTGSVASILLLHRALGPKCVSAVDDILPVSACRVMEEESNHLASVSSSSPCLEIELRPRNKTTSIIRGFSGDLDRSHNSFRTTPRPPVLPYLTSERTTPAEPQSL